ncbi:MAG: hypothetical protein RI907_3367 [Pseudomonadota bacterium]|jgi:hypothetical protein
MRVLKSFIPAVALMAVVPAAFAQSYGGLSLAYVRNSATCPDGPAGYCSAKHLGGLAYVGAKLAESSQLDLGIGKLDAFEAGLMQLGSKSFNQDVVTSRLVSSVRVYTTTTDSGLMSANGLYGAGVAHMDLAEDLQMVARLGVSYVSTTLKKSRVVTTSQGAYTYTSLGSSTDNRWQPFVGVGLEYKLMNELILSSRLDMTRVSANSRNGMAALFSVGAQIVY